MIANALTIAGSDPGGGAGIQADLKTFSALGVYGTSVLTALTAQSTRGVRGVHPVPAPFVALQIDTLLDDVRVDAVKIGMAGSAATVDAVVETLTRHRAHDIVLDPVMIAKSGDPLIDEEAAAAVRTALVPIATVVTPNVHEAGALLGRAPPRDVDAMAGAAEALAGLGAPWVLVKGGAIGGEHSPDVLRGPRGIEVLEAERVPTDDVHGTGCTLSSAIAALLARGAQVPEATREAKSWVREAIAAGCALSVGGGRGPVHHFHALWR